MFAQASVSLSTIRGRSLVQFAEERGHPVIPSIPAGAFGGSLSSNAEMMHMATAENHALTPTSGTGSPGPMTRAARPIFAFRLGTLAGCKLWYSRRAGRIRCRFWFSRRTARVIVGLAGAGAMYLLKDVLSALLAAASR
jgi:hypothetical protein